MKKLLSIILCLCLVGSLGSTAFAASPVQARVVLGADLNNEQVAGIYRSFGVADGSVPELNLTNMDERRYLQRYIDDSIIGTRAISCVYVELTGAGSGMDVQASNVTWCTPEMYVNALTTAGVTDAKVRVTAPFPVSGTAALAGVYKAYEDMTGRVLDDMVKDVSTQELAVTGELAQQIGSFDSTSIVSDLKLILNETAQMDDAELERQIRQIAQEHQVDLTDSQVGQLLSLCRSLEKLDADQLRSRVEELRGTIQKIDQAKDEVVGFAKTVYQILGALGDFFARVRQILGKE